MRVTFCGVRGSTPAPGPDHVRYGGHTSCVALGDEDGPPRLVLDGGTGLRALSASLGGAFRGSVLLGHLHWDHVMGLPFFGAGSRPGARVDVHLPAQGVDAERLLERLVSPPFFPVVPRQLGPGWSFSVLEAGPHLLEGFAVTALDVPHKGGRTFGFRVEDGRSSLAYVSDHDPVVLGPGPDGTGALHDAALALADGVDLLVHDAQIRAEEVPELGYLGHAAAEYAVRLATVAGARSVALYHHAPDRTDDQLDALAARFADSDVDVLVASEGLVLDLPRVPQTVVPGPR